MNETIQLLRNVARNARAGEAAIDRLISGAGSAEMRGELDRALEQYRDVARSAESALAHTGGPDAEAGVAQGPAAWSDIPMNTFTDRSNARIAERVIQGATMGIIEMTKARSACPDADPDAAGLASRLIVAQSDIIDRQKAYLREGVLV